MNGKRRPGEESAFGLAQKLGLEVYDALDLRRPKKAVFDVRVHEDILTPEDESQIGKILRQARERYAAKSGTIKPAR